MATDKQKLGDAGEALVAKHALCPGCKRDEKTLKVLPRNFKCADLVCDFCGYLAQVKTKRIKGEIPDRFDGDIPGAGWRPQKERMDAGIFFSLYIVLVNEEGLAGIYFLPRDLQTKEMFVPRNPLSAKARRSNWQGFKIRIELAEAEPIRVSDNNQIEFKTSLSSTD